MEMVLQKKVFLRFLTKLFRPMINKKVCSIILPALLFIAGNANLFSQNNNHYFIGDTLIITVMDDYISNNVPWREKRPYIIKAVINEGITKIGNNSFLWCGSLKTVTIPETVIKIGESAFRDCKELRSITIPKNVTEIGRQAFYGCTNLSEIINHNPHPARIDNFVFETKNQTACTLYVPDGSVGRYQQTDFWKNFRIRPLSVYDPNSPPDLPKDGLYVIVVGSFPLESQAKRYGESLGYNFAVIPITVNGGKTYRVSVESCDSKREADRLVEEWKSKPGIRQVIHYKRWW
jgi:hypothetical protein